MTEGIAERKKGAAIKEKSSAVGSEREKTKQSGVEKDAQKTERICSVLSVCDDLTCSEAHAICTQSHFLLATAAALVEA